MRVSRTVAHVALIAAFVASEWMSFGRLQAQAPALATFGEYASLAVDKSSLRQRGASADLIAKIDASAYRYFRLLSRQFAARTCFAFQDLRWRLPNIAVHGDAHLEQFVVTRTTHGIEDFDQAGYGPAVVDLVRYAASIHLACRQASWRCDPDQAVSSYFTAYREAIDHPVPPTTPGIVQRLRQTSSESAVSWLSWVDSQIHPLPPDEDALDRRGWARFVALVSAVRQDRPSSQFEISRLGSIDIGVGSALEKKLLVRTRGATDAPDDDLILEMRLTTRPTGTECVWRPPNGGSLHVILLTSLLGRRMPDIFGFLPQEQDQSAPEWWVQSWDPGYRELSIADITTQSELDELAADAAHQLAGHFWGTFPEPLRQYLRFAQLRAFELVETRARQLARELAAETVAGWERFRSGS
jgi:uncharacterized protein DUF2252